MKSKYKPYPNYRDSGAEWLGEIPEHWTSVRFGIIITRAALGGNYLSGEAEEGIPVIKMGNLGRGIISLKKIEYLPISERYNQEHLLQDGDFLFNTRNSLELVGKVSIWRSELKEAVYNSNVLKIVFNKRFIDNTRFMNYLFNSSLGLSQLRLIAKGTTNVAAIYYKELSSLIFDLPSLLEQQAIANYLDSATAKIDTLIEKQIKLIALLKEKRQAVISTAVTRGLDSTVTMKDSGIEWLGEIPKGWSTPKLKLFITTTKGFAFKADNFVEQGIPVVKMSEIKKGTIKESSVFLPKEFQLTHKQVLLRHKDIIVSTVGSAPEVKNSAVGQIGIVPEAHDGSLLNQNTVIFSPNGKLVSNDYLPYILKSQAYREHLDLHAHGTANQASLNLTDMLKFVFPLPPILEQEDIVKYIDNKTLKIDTLITKATRAIELLKEKRTALISSAVTGKIDVREEAV